MTGRDKKQVERTCCVTRTVRSPDEMIRFVAGPDGQIYPDLKQNLPGRGVWITADRKTVEEAIKKNAFSRALKTQIKVDDHLADEIDALLQKAALGSLSMARKAGQVVTGFTKVDSGIRSGKVDLVLHATDAAEDGVRKIHGAMHLVRALGHEVEVIRVFDAEQLGLALGGANVIHAAFTGGGATRSFIKRVSSLVRYRSGTLEREET